MAARYICDRCDRGFNHKNSLRRHQYRISHPYRRAIAECENCHKMFTSIDSLKKHKRLYCKSNHLSLEDYIDQLPEQNLFTPSKQDMQPLKFEFSDPEMNTPTMVNPFSSSKLDDVREVPTPWFTDSVKALFDEIKFTPPHPAAEDHVSTTTTTTHIIKDGELLNHLENTLKSWLHEIQRLEGTCKSDVTLKNDIYQILYRMLQDGLLKEQEYNDLMYTSKLFIKLQELINMYIPSLHKRDIIKLLLELYDMRRIDKFALIEVCNNL